VTDLVYTSRLDKPFESGPLTGDDPSEVDGPDRRDGLLYHLEPELQLVVEIALTTGRPLLLRGEPGSGKSSLAPFIARNRNARYYEHVVTSATRAQHLLWRLDAVRRLSDAQGRRQEDPEVPMWRYVEPGVLWWAFDQKTARRRGAPDDVEVSTEHEANDGVKNLNVNRNEEEAVVLIDEIDKADPDVPNALLVPLASSRFHVTEIAREIVRPQRTEAEAAKDWLSKLLIVITTNEERDLPPAFERRCITYRLPDPDQLRLKRIAEEHFNRSDKPLTDEERARIESLADKLMEARAATPRGVRKPGVAEFLDAVRACRALEVPPGDSDAWTVLERVVWRKWEERPAQ
jgi:MoxR-like ATPase